MEWWIRKDVSILTMRLLILLALLCVSVQADFYVSPSGSDANPGTEAEPFATLEAARDAIRAASPLGGPMTVYLRAGTHTRTNGFELTSLDTGTAAAPITYRNYTGETVILTGGLAITNFAAVSNPAILARLISPAFVQVADISGLNISDYGDLTNRGAAAFNYVSTYSGRIRPWMVELFSGTNRQQMSRWPNQDASGEVWSWTTTPVPAAPKTIATANWFTYRETNPDSWAFTEDVWLHGMWTYLWSDSYEKVISREANTNTFHTDKPGDYGFNANAPYEALNVLEELDQAGEWVIDRANSLIYFWPPTATPNQSTTISALTNDLISLTNAHYLSFQGLTLECGRGSGISMRNSSSNTIAGCEFRNFGNLGVVIGNAIFTNTSDEISLNHDYEGGLNNKILGCVFHDLGEGGVAVSGGVRSTLASSGHVLTNNYFYGFNRNIRCYRPAIKIDGVGVTVSHAVIRDSPHHAIWFSGNDHVIEYCNIYDVCQFTADAGSIYAVTRDWKQQGTVIRYNFIQPSVCHGIYLDDFTSGVTAYGNVIMCVLYPFLVGGGRNNALENNVVVGYSSVGWHVNNRGTHGTSTNSLPNMATKARLVDITASPYSKYSGMTLLDSDLLAWEAAQNNTTLTNLGYAKGNVVATNIFVDATAYNYDIDTNSITQALNYYTTSYQGSVGFATATTNAVRTRNFLLSESGDPFLNGMTQIPQSDINVASDSYGLVDPSLIAAYPPWVAQSPFKNLTIPGTIQVEDYDSGTNTAAFYNGNPNQVWNNAWGTGRYRRESEFYIWGSLSGNSLNYKMDLYPPGWTEYTVTALVTGDYTVTVSYQSMSGNYHIELDGVNVSGTLNSSTPSATFPITSGQHLVRLVVDGNYGAPGGRLDAMAFISPGYNRSKSTSTRLGNLKGR